MNTETKNIKKYIYALSVVLFIGAVLLVITHQVSHSLLDNLNKEKKNEGNRIEIAEVIIENINSIEKNFYHLFVVKSDLSQEQIAKSTRNSFQLIFSAIDILEKGGKLIVNLNHSLETTYKHSKVISYFPKEETNILEVHKLKTKLKEIQEFGTKVLDLTTEKEKLFKNGTDYNRIKKIKIDLSSFSKKTSSYFNEIRESVNKTFSTGYLNLQNIELKIKESEERYELFEWTFLISISLAMIFLSVVIVRKINKINNQLFSAKQETKTAFEELEETNAQLMQEIVEKKIAEDALAVSEHRLVSMWNSIHSGVILVQKENCRIIECNPVARKMINLPMESIIGEVCHHFLCADTGGKCPILETELNDGYFSECYLRTNEGNMIPILKTAVQLEINGVEYFLENFTDITILKEAEQALLNSKEKAENADKLKSIFLAQMSHEIRTPINVMLSVSSFLQMEIDDKLSEEQLAYFDLINKSGNRITRTVDLLINLSEIQAGTYEPSPERFDLFSDVLCILALDYKKRAEDKSIVFSVNLNTQDPTLIADIYTVEQIFKQLLENAIIFTEKGEINLTIRRNSSNKLIVEIKDTGVGIDKEYFNDLFTPFTQEEMGYTRKFDGNGIGLSLVKSYCDLNKATIEVESEKGTGSTFRVIFN